MMQMMKNIVRLTENELRDIIFEAVSKVYSKLPLYEYAVKRSKFVDNAWNLSHQILENWCLIRYSRMIGSERDVDHWKDELLAHMNNIGSQEIKSGNDYKLRVKAIKEGFGYGDLFGEADKIERLLQVKFKKEAFGDKDVIYNVISDFNKEIEIIIDTIAIANKDPMKLVEYVDAL